ncbi:hypothetical protein BDZ89DRAFT_1062373 [Hymenopellis radicata]|nr:hypothetical protein BDZ89DRAFT_1062373 [Hymenopellis radicata]
MTASTSAGSFSVPPYHAYDLRRHSMILMSFLWAISLATGCTALPVNGVRGAGDGVQTSRALLETRFTDNGSSSLKPSIWVPILIVCVVAVVLVCVYFYRRRSAPSTTPVSSSTTALNPTTSTTTNDNTRPSFWSSMFSGLGAGMGVVSPAGVHDTTGVREVTAETTCWDPPATAARRTRRPRRTPSQISTISLPVYMKEPGELELVIFRGPADMEDAPLPTDPVTVHMPALSEDGDPDNSISSHEYGRVPDTPHDVPLLANREENNNDAQIQDGPPGEGMPVRNLGHSRNGSAASSGGDEEDPRGAAPAYFEVAVVDLSQDNDPPSAPSAAETAPATPEPDAEATATSAPARRSITFRNFFGAFGSARSNYRSPYGPGQANATRHRQNQSSGGGSFLSSNNSHYPPLSGSPLNLSRTRSRSIISRGSRPNSPNANGSMNGLTSPSMISLTSISAPLTHTLVRTEFTYPKSGPTPEQLKLISSRETFSRFGVPYGEDAVRWASESRLALHDDDGTLPPDFDEPSGSRARPRSGTGASSHSRGDSGVSMGHQRAGSSTSLLAVPNAAVTVESPLATSSVTAETETEGEPTTSTPASPDPEAEPEADDNKRNTIRPTPKLSSAAPDDPSSPVPPATPASTSATIVSPSATIVPPSTTSSVPPSSFPATSTNLKRASTGPVGLGLPPGAAPPARSFSRASTVSVGSYATAAETLSVRTVTPTLLEERERREATDDTVRVY